MGSKRLKAIAVRGTGGVAVADPQRLLDLCLNASREGAAPEVPGAPARQWRPRMDPNTQMRARKCGFCATVCQDRLIMGLPGEVSPQPYSAVHQCWGYSTSPRAHTEARAITADYGINGWEISYGMIPWLQMCRQHGLIDTVNGLEIPVPDHEVLNLQDAAPVSGEFLVSLLESVAHRSGEYGDILAEGTCRAAEVLFGGKGLELVDRIYPRRCGETNHWNSHWGTGGSGYWPFWLMPVLQWCIDTRDPASDSTHQYTEHVLRYIPIHGPNRGPLTFEQARYVCEKVYGNSEICNPELTYDQPETKAIPAIFHHNRGMLVESLVLCDREHTRVFSMLSEDKVADTALMSKLFSAATGHEVSEQEMDLAGERVFNLLRAIDIRFFGRDAKVDWSVAETLTQPAFTDGVVLDLEKFRPMLDTYYNLRGWNPANGYPTRAKFEELGMADAADVMEQEGKLG
ncbi:MAG TPA: hypothetical protein GX714_16985 [Chloroflexi bacterium]|nr:hypothetical protein [Chloroflexota bacterium]